MKLLAFIPIRLTLLLIFGIVIGYLFTFDPIYPLFSTLFLFALLATIFRFERNTKSLIFGILAALSFMSLGVYCYTVWQPINHSNHYSKQTTSATVLWKVKIKEVLKPTQFFTRYFASVITSDNIRVSGTLLITIPRDSSMTSLQVDDELLTYAVPQNINPSTNPHQFDYRKYLENLGIYHRMHIPSNQFIKIEHTQSTLIGTAAKVRNHIIEKLKKHTFGEDELGVIQALLLGQRTDISEETYNNYQKAGAVHILALSGLHIGILLLLIQFLLRPLSYLPNGRTMTLIISVIFLWGFAFIAGLSASIIRATTMFTFVAYTLYLNRPSNSFNILALSILFILLFINPNLLFQVGFQMSYAAVFAILWIFPLLKKLWFPKNKVVRYFWQLLCVSIAAQLGVLPISLFYFHQFPGLFFVSNLVIVPALGLILGIGILVIILSLLNSVPTQLVWFYNEIISLMNSLIAWVAQQESFIFSSISFDAIQLILSFLVLLLGVELYNKQTFKHLALFFVSIFCFQGWTIYREIEAGRSMEAIVLNQTRNSIVLNRNGKSLSILTNNTDNIDYLISAYTTAERIDSIRFDPLQNSYTMQKASLLIIDSTGIYPEGKSNTILLTQSPKINLERAIESLGPSIVIADGSNYKSHIDRWKVTCLKNKIPFHYTNEKGAYYFE